MTNSSKILMRIDNTSTWTTPESFSYTNEKQLQEIVAASPQWGRGLLAGSPAVREFHMPAGPVDVMIVTLDGSPTAVEYTSTSSACAISGQAVIPCAAVVDSVNRDGWVEAARDLFAFLSERGLV